MISATDLEYPELSLVGLPESKRWRSSFRMSSEGAAIIDAPAEVCLAGTFWRLTENGVEVSGPVSIGAGDLVGLAVKIQPRVPSNREENERLLAEIETLMRRGAEKLSPAEERTLEMLFTLVREYEQRAYPAKKSTAAETLKFLMEENRLRAVDLPVRSKRVFEILSGKREVSKAEAKTLADFFHVSPALFV